MKKYIVALFIFIMILPGLELLSLRKITGIENRASNHVINFFKGHDFQQQFISPKNNLYSIEIKLKNSNMRNHDPVTFTLTSKDTLQKLDLNGTNIRDSDWTRFTFEEISQSQNQSFTFTLSSPSSMDNALAIEINNQKQAAFVTHHRIPSRLNLITETYQQFLKKLMADKFFLVAWALLILVLLKNSVKFKN